MIAFLLLVLFVLNSVLLRLRLDGHLSNERNHLNPMHMDARLYLALDSSFISICSKIFGLGHVLLRADLISGSSLGHCANCAANHLWSGTPMQHSAVSLMLHLSSLVPLNETRGLDELMRSQEPLVEFSLNPPTDFAVLTTQF